MESHFKTDGVAFPLGTCVNFMGMLQNFLLTPGLWIKILFSIPVLILLFVLFYFCFSFPSPRNSYEQMWWSVGIFWNFIFHISIRKLIPDSNCGAAGAGRQPGPEFQFPLKWWDSLPSSGCLEPANQQVPKREQKEHEGKRKSPRMPKLEQNPKFKQKPAKVCTNKIALQKFVTIKLLCKRVTNLLKPGTNCLCSPYKFMLTAGALGFFWPCTTALAAAESPGSSQ